jgi:serine-type D-Ala-D-Ala carboxypeptidase/endopeptidase (penicillin-binding protein 4)
MIVRSRVWRTMRSGVFPAHCTPERSITSILYRTFALVLLLLPTATASGQPLLTREIERIIDDPRFENAFWGVLVKDLSTGTVLYRRNEAKSFMPASNTKLYTTAAALDQLGPEYRFVTRLFVDGPISDRVLTGNVIVRGGADPTIGGHYHATGRWEEDLDPTVLFRAWADSLRALGIQRIVGDIIGDDDVIDDVPLGAGWNWDDIPFYYAAELSGLAFNDNVVHFKIHGRTAGAPAEIEWAPYATDYVQVINQTQTLPSGARLREGYHRDRGTNTIRISSRVPAGTTDSEEISIDNPTLFFVHVLRETLLRQGIAVEGRPVDVDEISIKPDYSSGTLRRAAVHYSPPLRDVAAMINKPSQNLYAELLLKKLGAERPMADPDAAHGSARLGIAAGMETFARAGVDTSRIQLADGSGLSRRSLVTPNMTSALLGYMWSHPEPAVRAAFYDSLPVGGGEGTLRNRLRDPAIAGRVRAKTGTLGNVSSLSGYVTTTSGTPLSFVLMSNHFTTPAREVREAQDAIVNVLITYRPQAQTR